MMKKKYITPEFEEIRLDLENLLVNDSGSEGKGEGGGGTPVDDPDDIGAKGWGGDFFNADE